MVAVVALLAAGALHDAISAIAAARPAVRTAVTVRAGVVGLSLVTQLVGRDNAVAANACALRLPDAETLEGEPVSRLILTALSLEHSNLVNLSDDHSEAATRVGGAVERDAPLRARVDPADVDSQLLVDEHPNVVVAVEGQRLIARPLKPVVKLAGEIEAVAGSSVVPTTAIERKETLVIVNEDATARRLLGQRERVADGLGVVGVAGPFAEVVGVRRVPVRLTRIVDVGRRRVDRLALHVEGVS